MSNATYEKGCKIVYGNNGICEVADITPMSFSANGGDSLYYILRPASSPASTIFVPCDNQKLTSKMRDIMRKDDIDQILSGMRGHEIEWIDDRRARSEKFHVILSGGINEELLLMIRCIYIKKRSLSKLGKKLSSSDEQILSSAQKLVEQEFAFALCIDPEEVSGYIRASLGITD